MSTRPHDISDLYLAPLVLALDARIEELGAMDRNVLRRHVALVSDKPDSTRELREAGLLAAVGHLIDTHHWQLSWCPRGLRVTHDGHQLVLGVPAIFAEFISGSAAR